MCRFTMELGREERSTGLCDSSDAVAWRGGVKLSYSGLPLRWVLDLPVCLAGRGMGVVGMYLPTRPVGVQECATKPCVRSDGSDSADRSC